MSDQPDDDLIRELYARFGFAYFQSECLHRELCFVLALSALPTPDLITGPRADEELARAYGLTLGDVAAKLESVLPVDLVGELREAVAARNFLAHQFWFERARFMLSVRGVGELLAEVDRYAEQFRRLDALVSDWKKPKIEAFGFSDQVIDDAQRRVLAGEPDDPLPTKRAVREMERKLRKRQRLTRVWQAPTGAGLNSIVFELSDGSLWQLSDVGLAWTKFHKIDANWTEHPATKPYLPADIMPRPKTKAAWHYEFVLGRSATLWVRPGQQEKTFKWGVRAAKKTPLGIYTQPLTLCNEGSPLTPRQFCAKIRYVSRIQLRIPRFLPRRTFFRS
jgi:hypothetical protein